MDCWINGCVCLQQSIHPFPSHSLCANSRDVWNITPMPVGFPKTATRRRADTVIQFSVFTPNRLGRLHELVNLLGSHNVHVLALTVMDTTDSAIIRVVVDDPDRARGLFHDHDFPFTESPLVVVEV